MSQDHLTDTEEIWKTVPSFNLYEASNLGRIRRRAFANPSNSGGGRIGQILTPVTHTSGYSFYCLRKAEQQGKQFNAYAQILIAETFLGPKPKGFEVNHKDGIKAHNTLSNLEYITSSENQKHAFMLGLQKGHKGSKQWMAKLTEQNVVDIRAALPRPIRRKDCERLAPQYGVCWQTIRHVASGRGWKHV